MEIIIMPFEISHLKLHALAFSETHFVQRVEEIKMKTSRQQIEHVLRRRVPRNRTFNFLHSRETHQLFALNTCQSQKKHSLCDHAQAFKNLHSLNLII